MINAASLKTPIFFKKSIQVKSSRKSRHEKKKWGKVFLNINSYKKPGRVSF